MTKEEWHHKRGPSPEPMAQRLRVMIADEKTAPSLEAMERRRRSAAMALSTDSVAEEIDDCLDELVRSGAIDMDVVVAQARQEQRVARRKTLTVRFTASAAMLSALVAGIVLFQEVAATHASGDEPRLITLEDGSRVELNTHSELQVRFSPGLREVTLRRGEAMFEVQSDPTRPFQVRVDETIAEAVGTQFDVRRMNDHTAIAVVEGVVQLRSAASVSRSKGVAHTPSLPRITAGLSVMVDREGRADAPVPVDVVAIAAWRRPLGLRFPSASLGEIADAFNHRNAKPKLIIEGDALRGRRFSIAFDTADPRELVKYLEEDEALMFISTSDQVVVRERSH